MVGQLAHAGQRADGDLIVLKAKSVETAQLGNIDQGLRLLNSAFHQVEQGGATGEKTAVVLLAAQFNGRVAAAGALIVEGIHADSLLSWAAASRTASTMCG